MMIRYTALFNQDQGAATPADLRQALKAALAESQAAESYRMGAVAPLDGQMAAEVAGSLPREALSTLLAETGETKGYRLEKVGWGWLLSGRMTFELEDERSGDLLYDPLADTNPQEEAARSYRFGLQQAASLALVVLGAGLVVALVLGYLLIPSVAGWAAKNLVNLMMGVFLFWLLLRLLGTIVTPWSYLRSIEVDEAGITLRGLLQPSVKAAWGEIDELQVADRRALMLLGDGVVSFPVHDRLGMSDQLCLLRTIIQRAELLYVGGKVGNILYRKFDA